MSCEELQAKVSRGQEEEALLKSEVRKLEGQLGEAASAQAQLEQQLNEERSMAKVGKRHQPTASCNFYL